MSYEQALEKAVLEHAANVRRHPPQRRDKPTKIPGFPDPLVWGTARMLADKGLIETTSVDGNGQVIIDDLSEEGSARLQEIRDAEEQAATAERERRAKAVEDARAAKKPFWKFW